jgi:hypothetical protein
MAYHPMPPHNTFGITSWACLKYRHCSEPGSHGLPSHNTNPTATTCIVIRPIAGTLRRCPSTYPIRVHHTGVTKNPATGTSESGAAKIDSGR